MPRPRVRINIRQKGVTAAAEKIRAVGMSAHEQRSTMDDLARNAADAITRVPRDTGRLDDSLKDGAAEQYKRVTNYGYEIGTTVPYARFVFRGTGKMKARPPRVSRKRLNDEAALAIAADLIRANK
jgi:hypothetical protein